MIAYWTQFAKTGDPNSADEPQWLAYDPATDLRQSFVPPTPGVEASKKLRLDTHKALPAVLMTCSNVTP